MLNLGLPRLPDTPDLQGDKLQTGVGNLFAAFYAQHGRCPNRKLRINITVAGDYQILDWLGQGLLDAAVVPDLTVYLLTQHDTVSLQEVDVPDPTVGNLLLPAFQSQPRSERFAGGSWETRGNPERISRIFWRRRGTGRAIHPRGKLRPSRCRDTGSSSRLISRPPDSSIPSPRPPARWRAS